MSRRQERRKRRHREVTGGAEAEVRLVRVPDLADVPRATPVNPVAVALEEIERREQAEQEQAGGGEVPPQEAAAEPAFGTVEDAGTADPERRRRPAYHRRGPITKRLESWRAAIDTHSLLYMGVALFVAVLVFLVLRYLDLRDLAPSPLPGS